MPTKRTASNKHTPEPHNFPMFQRAFSKVEPTTYGFKMYGREWDVVNSRQDLNMQQRQTLLKKIHDMADKPAQRHWVEREAIATLHCLQSETVHSNRTAARNPFVEEPAHAGCSNGVLTVAPFRSVIISTSRGSLCIVHNNGGVHNMYSNNPYDMYTFSRLLKLLPTNWCYTAPHNIKLWGGHGFTLVDDKDQDYFVMSRCNNGVSKPGKRVSDRLWNRFLKALPEFGCIQWELTK
jgi:hypothetical protein